MLDLPRRLNNQAVHIDAEMEQLVALATEQNFVPVVDDRGVFVGIVRRRTIIEYLAKKAVRSAEGKAMSLPPRPNADR